MVSIFAVNRGRTADDEELALGTPDLSEAQSLERHVDRCALRYRMFSRRIVEQGKSLTRMERLAYAVLVVVVVTNPKLWDIVSAIASLLK